LRAELQFKGRIVADRSPGYKAFTIVRVRIAVHSHWRR